MQHKVVPRLQIMSMCEHLYIVCAYVIMYTIIYVRMYVHTYVSHITHTKEGAQMAEWCTVYVCTMQHEALYYKYICPYVHHHTKVTSDACVYTCVCHTLH